MPQWDIDPAGVQGVVTRTQTVAEQLTKELKAVDAAAEGAGSNCGSSIVAGSLSGFLTARTPDLQFLVSRTTAALTGAVNATNAYVAGDLQMAANAQAAATGAPSGSFAVPGGRMRAQ